jgi:Zn-dependent peptidase ImmA (M78 family)/transcriptional regulator with XRE-family HTH domain
MSDTVNTAIFGARLWSCLELHGMTVSQLAERTAIEEQRIRELLEASGEPRYYELIGIADTFRIELSAFVSPDTRFPVTAYRVACKHFYPDRGAFSNSNSPIEFATDNRIKINETLLACQFLQDMWEKSNFPGSELSWSVNTGALGKDPEEAGKVAARQFRDKIGIRHDVITPHLRQYARQVGVHVFRQNIDSMENASQKKALYGFCLFGQIGKNKDGRLVIYSSALPYHAEQFCIAHELGHAFLGALNPPIGCGGLYGQVMPDSREEQMADAFASELLLPHAYISANADRIRKFDSDALFNFCEDVSCCAVMTADKLWNAGLIDDELRDTVKVLKNVKTQSEPYSPQLQELLKRLCQKGYADTEVKCFRELIDRGLSNHFVLMCKKTFASGNKDKIITRCADIFSVSELQIEKAFEMYEFIRYGDTIPAPSSF